ncbi:MAG TPA: FAD-binding oxidoreductase [Candidatus Eremiobacteraeota bacterium]|nr:MAG: putative FAD-linked oxidoreductase [bacterium ADurb.Bin363]HPZ07993.1 FAD-binding oxidoreductase [Candidatus Eremiobacteraeota bacterium]
MYKKIDSGILQELEHIVGKKNLITERENMEDYGHDEIALSHMRNYPEVVLRPSTSKEISEILKLANKHLIPVVARGGGTGLAGGCVPVFGGIVISLEKMNKFLELDEENLMATMEAGVTLMKFHQTLQEKNLFFPPHPGEESATIGGIISTNAGGARAVKYGTVRNFVRSIEVVLPQGDIVKLGGKLLKDSSGYNLLHLMIGSEGTLGIVTKGTFSIMPIPKASLTLIIPFDDVSGALKSVPHILCSGILPLSIEFVSSELIIMTKEFLKKSWPVQVGNVYLLIILEGEDMEEVEKASMKVSEVCLSHKAIDVFVAESRDKQDEILEIRSKIYEALKSKTVEAIDIVLPRNQIEPHLKRLSEIEKEADMWLPTFGHAADGNLHTHISKFNLKGEYIEDWEKKYEDVRRAIHDDAIERGGKISGEHGIGFAKKEYLEIFTDKSLLQLMKGIKRTFDPNNILNPGKIFDLTQEKY